MYFEDILNLIFGSISLPVIAFAFVVFLGFRKGIKFVPQNQAFVIERFGKFQSVKEAGLNFLIPFIDAVAANRTLKEQAVDVPRELKPDHYPEWMEKEDGFKDTRRLGH